MLQQAKSPPILTQLQPFLVLAALAGCFALHIGIWVGVDRGELPSALLFVLVPNALLSGFLFFVCAIMAHEGIHGHLSSNRRINEVLYHFLGSLIQANPTLYRALHLTHHSHPNLPQDWELRPETRRDLSARSRRWALIRLALLGGVERTRLWVPFLWRTDSPLPEKVIRRARHWEGIMRLFFVAIAVAWIGLVGSAASWVTGFLVPLLIGAWLMTTLQLIEHFGRDSGIVPNVSRDIVPVSRFQRALYALMFNINFHTVHHIRAQVPGHWLPETHEQWAAEMRQQGRAVPATYPSYLSALRELIPLLWNEIRNPAPPVRA